MAKKPEAAPEAPEVVERMVNGPEQDYLTESEAAAWLRLDPEDFRDFVRLGFIPKGMPWGKQPKTNHRWPWLDVVAVGHLIARGFLRLPGAEEGDDSTPLPHLPPAPKREKSG